MRWNISQQLVTIYSTGAKVQFKLFNDDVWHSPLYFSPGRRQAEIIGFIYLFRQQACSRSQYLFFLPRDGVVDKYSKFKECIRHVLKHFLLWVGSFSISYSNIFWCKYKYISLEKVNYYLQNNKCRQQNILESMQICNKK
jgi:hypothetical protein